MGRRSPTQGCGCTATEGTCPRLVGAQVTLPALLALTSLQAAPAFARGVGIGCTAHVGGMAALAASGDLAAADSCVRAGRRWRGARGADASAGVQPGPGARVWRTWWRIS